MKRIQDSAIQEILDRADIVQIIGEHVRLEKAGSRYKGLCPFHNEKTPSFNVDPIKGFFYCFGCQKGGSLVSFLMELEKLSYVEALEFLAKKTGVEIRYDGSDSYNKEDSRRSDLIELYKRVSAAFHYILLNSDQGSEARAYIKKRALSDDIIKRFLLGWAPSDRKWLHRFLKGKGYADDFLTSSGLFSKKYPETSFFSSRLMFPILNAKGETIAFGGRIMGGEGPKYINSSDSAIFHKSETLFPFFQAQKEIRKTGSFILCEGYMDAISLHQAGIENAVAPLGTAFTEHQARLMRRFAENATLLFDSDEAGQNATRKAILLCRRAGIATKVSVPEGSKDPSEILEKEGVDSLKKLLENSINDFDYLVKRAVSLYNIDTIEGKAEAAGCLFPYIDALDSDVKRDACFSMLADKLMVDVHSIVRDHGRRVQPREVIRNARDDARNTRLNGDLFLMLAIAANRKLFQNVRGRINSGDLENADARAIFFALEECYRNDENDMDAFLLRLGEDRLRNIILEKTSSEEFTTNPDILVQDGVRAISLRTLEKRRMKLIRDMKEAEGASLEERGILNELMYEKMGIDAELAKLKGERE